MKFFELNLEDTGKSHGLAEYVDSKIVFKQTWGRNNRGMNKSEQSAEIQRLRNTIAGIDTNSGNSSADYGNRARVGTHYAEVGPTIRQANRPLALWARPDPQLRPFQADSLARMCVSITAALPLLSRWLSPFVSALATTARCGPYGSAASARAYPLSIPLESRASRIKGRPGASGVNGGRHRPDSENCVIFTAHPSGNTARISRSAPTA